MGECDKWRPNDDCWTARLDNATWGLDSSSPQMQIKKIETWILTLVKHFITLVLNKGVGKKHVNANSPWMPDKVVKLGHVITLPTDMGLPECYRDTRKQNPTYSAYSTPTQQVRQGKLVRQRQTKTWPIQTLAGYNIHSFTKALHNSIGKTTLPMTTLKLI